MSSGKRLILFSGGVESTAFLATVSRDGHTFFCDDVDHHARVLGCSFEQALNNLVSEVGKDDVDYDEESEANANASYGWEG